MLKRPTSPSNNAFDTVFAFKIVKKKRLQVELPNCILSAYDCLKINGTSPINYLKQFSEHFNTLILAFFVHKFFGD